MRQWLAVLILLWATGEQAVAGTRWIQRPDDMVVYWLHDVDRRADTLRILYSTTPSLEQGQADRDGWRTNVYLVEARVDGRVEQHRLASRHEYFAALLLRRGYDEVLAVRRPDGQGKPQRLERWSTRDGSVLGAALAPTLAVSAGQQAVDLALASPTGDGNLFLALQDRARPGAISWYKLSAGGKVLGKGSYAKAGTQIQPTGWFAARDGGFGMTVRLDLARGSKSLPTDIDTPVIRKIGGRTIEARVASETRMVVMDAAGRLRWVSPALVRQLMWGGQMQIPASLPNSARIEQLHRQMRLTEDTELALGARRTLVEATRFKRTGDAVKPTPTGYGVLARTVANRRRTPPAHGVHYLQISNDGSLQRDVYLQPVAEQLDAKITRFLPTADGNVLLAGSRRADTSHTLQTYVAQVGADGSKQWSAALDAPPGGVDGIDGPEPGVWVFGHGRQADKGKTLLWLERVEQPAPGQQERESAQTAPAGSTSLPSATATPSSDCTCSCAEFAEIQHLARQTHGMPDPATVQKLSCAQQCLSAYQQCPRH